MNDDFKKSNTESPSKIVSHSIRSDSRYYTNSIRSKLQINLL